MIMIIHDDSVRCMSIATPHGHQLYVDIDQHLLIPSSVRPSLELIHHAEVPVVLHVPDGGRQLSLWCTSHILCETHKHTHIAPIIFYFTHGHVHTKAGAMYYTQNITCTCTHTPTDMCYVCWHHTYILHTHQHIAIKYLDKWTIKYTLTCNMHHTQKHNSTQAKVGTES